MFTCLILDVWILINQYASTFFNWTWCTSIELLIQLLLHQHLVIGTTTTSAIDRYGLSIVHPVGMLLCLCSEFVHFVTCSCYQRILLVPLQWWMFSNRLRQHLLSSFRLKRWTFHRFSGSSVLLGLDFDVGHSLIWISSVQIGLAILLLYHQAAVCRQLVVLHLLHHLYMLLLLLLLSWLGSQYHAYFINFIDLFVVPVLRLLNALTLMMLCAHNLIYSHLCTTSISLQPASIPSTLLIHGLLFLFLHLILIF